MSGDPAVGLTTAEVEALRARYGRNTLPEPRRRTFAAALRAQFGDVMVIILIVAAAIAAIVGETADLAAIVTIVTLNAVLGAVQEERAERARASLRALAAPTARVRRDGLTLDVPAAELVPGDIVVLEAGNFVPADIRLQEVVQLQAAEAALTGESEAVHKAAVIPDAVATADDQRIIAFHGTCITHGRGLGVVVATGTNTRLGHIAALLRDERQPRTPLQFRLDQLGRRLSLVAVALCVVILVAGLARGESFALMLMTALSIAVAAIPEALPAVVTIALAIGARRLARHNALIRRLPAVETLGSVTVICVDKTGTLTENRMRVESVIATPAGSAHEPPSEVRCGASLLEAMAISNDVHVSPAGDMKGDPTEVALCCFAANAGFAKAGVEPRLVRVAELTFSPDRARMTTLHRRDPGRGEIIAFTKGAPERVLPSCDRWNADGDAATFDRGAILRTAAEMAGAGLRVLAFATSTLPALPSHLAAAEQRQAFLGLVGLLDPPRPEAPSAVVRCQTAGVRVVMITGDHAETGFAIARRLGIATERESVLTGSELRELNDSELDDRVERIRVYARASPEDKIRIVKALQTQGEFVAMTGDGVNDAPALQRANIGVAMGRSGTDVARDAAAMVLLDDNFATIVAAVREGRRIYDNIRKFVRYVLTCNLGEILTLLLAPVFGLPLPLLPIQILWINLVTDGLPGLALTTEPAERGAMERPPRPPAESVLAHGLWQHILWVGALIGGLTLAVEALGLRTGSSHWRSLTFTVLTFTQMAHVMAIRSERESLFRQGLFSNPGLLGAVSLTIGLQIAILHVPALQSVFRTEALSLAEFAFATAAAFVVFVAVEVEKLIRRAIAL